MAAMVSSIIRSRSLAWSSRRWRSRTCWVTSRMVPMTEVPAPSGRGSRWIWIQVSRLSRVWTSTSLPWPAAACSMAERRAGSHWPAQFRSLRSRPGEMREVPMARPPRRGVISRSIPSGRTSKSWVSDPGRAAFMRKSRLATSSRSRSWTVCSRMDW